MDAVWRDIPESLLAERRRLGHDRKDECWDGVIHMVPPPSGAHDRLVNDLGSVLERIGARHGLLKWTAGLFASATDYRVPDLALARADQSSQRGLEGAELVVEVLSPRDDSRQKFGFYTLVGVREIWLIEPGTRVTEIYQLVDAAYRPIAFAAARAISPLLGITLEIVDGPLLRLRDGAETYDL